MNDRNDQAPKERRHRRLGRTGRFAVLAVALVGLGVTAAGVVGASRGGPEAHSGHHHGWHRMGGHRHDFGARALAHLSRLAELADASDEQIEAIRVIVESALEDIEPLADTRRTTRRALLEELARPSVDRDAIETLRTEALASLDEGSARVLDALVDAAEVLTAEQREQLAERAARFHHRRHGGSESR